MEGLDIFLIKLVAIVVHSWMLKWLFTYYQEKRRNPNTSKVLLRLLLPISFVHVAILLIVVSLSAIIDVMHAF